MDIFDFRDDLIGDYAEYVRSFVHIRDARIASEVDESLASGRLWPQPLLQLNPSFEPGGRLDALASEAVLHPKTPEVFRVDKTAADPLGSPLAAHRHQVEALRVAHGGHPYVVTTGTGSGLVLPPRARPIDCGFRIRNRTWITFPPASEARRSWFSAPQLHQAREEGRKHLVHAFQGGAPRETPFLVAISSLRPLL